MSNSPRVATVSQINNYIKKILDGNIILNDIWIKGEISNFKAHYSGHLYITLKDEGSVLKAVMFRNDASKLGFTPRDGMKVVARGRIAAYEAGGVYQLYIKELIPDGVGSLHVAFEQLKRKLEKEGLFSPQHKKKIPRLPDKIGVVTASTGAAVRDIIHVITRRYPLAHIIVYPATVQGAEAAPSIVKGIEFFNSQCNVDTVIVGRGGGSIEDLWAFNEESVAYAIYNSQIPIISAVGHETDFTIADFVADLRAPTPSAAAEVAVPSRADLTEIIRTSEIRIIQNLNFIIALNKDKLERLSVKNPARIIADYRLSVDSKVKNIIDLTKIKVIKKRKDFVEICAALDALSPLSVLSRGYAIPLDDERNVLKSIDDMNSGKDFNLKMKDGEVRCTVK